MATNRQEGSEPVIDIVGRDDGVHPAIRVRGESNGSGSLVEFAQVGAGAALKVTGDIHLDGDLLDGSGQSGTYAAISDVERTYTVSSTFGDGLANATAAIQEKLDAANAVGGGTVVIPDGTYLITTALTIGNYTHLKLSPKATIKRNAAIDNMLRNKNDGVTTGYGQANDIIVSGGTWDANKAGFASNTTVITFGHATRCMVRDTTIKNVHGWHFIEYNAVQHGWIKDVVFLDFDTGTTAKEAVQLDMMAGSGPFPWFGPYDNTVCDDIQIVGCTFVNHDRGIGSHTAVSGSSHTNILIDGNYFYNCREEAIYAYTWERATIVNNHIENCWKGIVVETNGSGVRRDYVIADNVLYNLNHDVNASRGIEISSDNKANNFQHGTIRGNVIRDVARHGIGIDWGSNWVVQGNTVESDLAGVWVYASDHVTVTGNFLDGGASNGGLEIGPAAGTNSDTADVVVTGNVIDKIKVHSGSRILIEGNNLTNVTYVANPDTTVTQRNNYVSSAWEPVNNSVRLPGTTGNYISTPDAADISIVGDIDIRAKVTLDDWTPATTMDVVSKANSATDQRSYMLNLHTDGTIRLFWSTAGTAFISKASTAATGVTDGQPKWIRATLDVDNGASGNDTKFYTSDDGVTWAQLGTTVTTATATSIFDGTAALVIGAKEDNVEWVKGYIHYAEVRSGIDGTVIAFFDPKQVVPLPGTSSVDAKNPTTVAQSGRTWTLNGTGWSWVSR